MLRPLSITSLLIACLVTSVSAQEKIDTSRGDRMIAEYFRIETAKLSKRSLAEVRSLDDWQTRKGEYRRQLFEMLSLDPMPERTELKATTTGKIDNEEFTVENVHFQSRPGLYVTGNLYLPKNQTKPVPAVLYVCGHGGVKKDGVSYGNKVHYHHHGVWFARHGYVCLVIDSLQLGEIEATHHGTYRYKMWWWNARGYTSAGVEAWNCIRALDYLQTRKEVDGDRLGVTGRSGGGAYSWWVAALDDRIKAAVPVAGITDLENHVVDGTVEGHCDCMFTVNTYRWDYPQVAALVAPRPLLISNSDKDGIFPLEGVLRTHLATRRIYRLHKADGNLGLQITEGPHKDTQELRVHAFGWFNRFLKHQNPRPLIDRPAVSLFEPEQLQVFKQLPTDQKNTTIHETFVAKAAAPLVPKSAGEWNRQREGWMQALKQKVFRGWPTPPGGLDVKQAFTAEHEGVRLSAFDFTSQAGIRLRLYLAHRADLKKADLVVLNAMDGKGWRDFLATYRTGFEKQLAGETLPEADGKSHDKTWKMFKSFNWMMAYVAPRGIGPTAWDQSARKQTQHRRRFMLLGQTQDSMRVWDIRRAAQTLRQLPQAKDVSLWMQGSRETAGNVLYASLFEPDVARLDLHDLPTSHRKGPIFLNVLRFLDTPAAVAMATERSKVRIYDEDSKSWEYPQAVAKRLDWNAKQLQIRAAIEK